MIVSVQNKSIEVTFIDFGNSAIVTVTDIRPIYSEFLKLPAQVFVCTLADIEPKEKAWSHDAISSFENMVLDKHLAAYVKSKSKNCCDIFLRGKKIPALFFLKYFESIQNNGTNLLATIKYYQ